MNEDDQFSVDVELGKVTDWFRLLIHFCKVSVSRAVCNDEY